VQLGAIDTGVSYALSDTTGLAEGQGVLAVPMSDTLVVFG
jgi:hypothetical protein